MVKFVEGTHNGFCSGVQSAVNAVERKARELGRVYTYGPIIHLSLIHISAGPAKPISKRDVLRSRAER